MKNSKIQNKTNIKNNKIGSFVFKKNAFAN